MPTDDGPHAAADPNGTGEHGSLDALRDRLDAVDASLLDLIAERLRLSAEVARRKAASGSALFRREREEDVIAARRASGRSRGIDPELCEDVFRRLILESHKWQSAIIRESSGVDRKKVAIIGGEGAMGSFLARFLGEQGHDVVVADVDTDVTPERAAGAADAVIVSVPIRATEEVIRRVGPLVREGGLLMDVTSLKQAPVRAMLESSRCEVIGAHPMFAPSVGSVHRQVVALCPARGERWLEWVRGVLLSQGAEIIVCTPEQHDRAMSVIQVLRHAATIAFGRALHQLGVDIEDSLRYSSPIYRLELIMTGRLFGQDPELYADLGLGNPHRRRAVDALEAAVEGIAEIVRTGDRDGFIAEFEKVASYFDGFSERAMAESGALIQRMVERM